MKLKFFAPAKVNLALHITGRRSDGYHQLESLVIFPNIFDRMSFESATHYSLNIDGPFKDGLISLNQQNHIIKKAIEKFSETQRIKNRSVKIQLTKNLPLSSGIGGGSSNAAATLLALNQLWQCNLNQNALAKIAISIGADVPVCLTKKPSLITGIGENVSNLPRFPSGSIVLANSNIPLSSQKVFSKLIHAENYALPEIPENFSGFSNLIDWLSNTRNDLESVAIDLVPEIKTIKTMLTDQKNCVFERMSGSGTTCFGLFEKYDDALQAEQHLLEKFPNWWVKAGKF